MLAFVLGGTSRPGLVTARPSPVGRDHYLCPAPVGTLQWRRTCTWCAEWARVRLANEPPADLWQASSARLGLPASLRALFVANRRKARASRPAGTPLARGPFSGEMAAAAAAATTTTVAFASRQATEMRANSRRRYQLPCWQLHAQHNKTNGRQTRPAVQQLASLCAASCTARQACATLFLCGRCCASGATGGTRTARAAQRTPELRSSGGRRCRSRNVFAARGENTTNGARESLELQQQQHQQLRKLQA